VFAVPDSPHLTSTPLRSRVLLGASLILALLLGLLLAGTSGQFVYSLDDPYIHLALARHLPGFYGVSTQPAAASSSLLYPWLLIPFAKAGFELGPFLLNLAATLGSLLVLTEIEAHTAITRRFSLSVRAFFILLIFTACNLFALPFMGMEHSLHVLMVLLTLLGLMRVEQNQPAPRWLWLALILSPLLRLEGLALSGLALLWLLRAGYWRPALLTGLLIGLLQAAHAFYLHSQGLPWLPGSALIKFQEAGLLYNLQTPGGMVLAILALTLGISALAQRSSLAALGMTATLAHLLLSRCDWMDRYHAYIMAFDLPLLLWLLRAALQRYLDHASHGLLIPALVLLLLGVSSFKYTMLTPAAAQDIYLQHVQITNFVAQDWQQPIAANDIGLLSWRSPAAVYDLYGLGDEQVRQLLSTQQGWTAASLDAYVKAHNIQLVLVHERLVSGAIPGDWQKIATLTRDDEPVLIDRSLDIYATAAAYPGNISQLVQTWQKTLPAEARITYAAQP